MPLYIAGAASLQGWDALMQFAYSQEPLNRGGAPSVWQSFNDPGLLATLPAAALLYRRKDVKEADTVYVFAPTAAQLFDRAISPANSIALRSATEKGKLVIALPQTRELPWLEKSHVPAGAKVITDPDKSVIDAGASEAVSDTGELRRNWEQGIYTINSPNTQAATGWIGGKKINLADVDVDIDTPNASVAVQSLDENRINQAQSILISLGTPSVPESGNHMPFHTQLILGHLSIRAPAGLRLYERSDITPGEHELTTRYVNGRYQIDLPPDRPSSFLFLKSEKMEVEKNR